MEALGGIAIALVMLFGGYRVLVANAPPGEFFTFATAFLLLYEPAKRLARLNVDLSQSLIGVRMVYELLDLPAPDKDEDKPPLAVSKGKIEFADVNFAYRVDDPVLRGMSFVVEPGQLTALVGPSGGGKSTIFNLLLRFFDVSSGVISIDGQNIASVSRRSLREQIAYVGQDAFLFRGSIRDNIALGRLGASDEEIVAAAKAAHAHEFIMNFPLAYDAPVGEHGMQLSGGQRQRIAVARALIRNAPIILLDEPTASLDTESERQVHLAISRLLQGRTKLVIAHRLHTIEHADMIYVVENGEIVECGRHDSLLRQGRRYADFHNLQFATNRVGSELLLESNA
jgi:ATP-binding cassette subfamily B protein